MGTLKYAAENLQNIEDPDARYAMWKTLTDWLSSVAAISESGKETGVKLALENAVPCLLAEVQKAANDRFGAPILPPHD